MSVIIRALEFLAFFAYPFNRLFSYKLQEITVILLKVSSMSSQSTCLFTVVPELGTFT